MTSMVLMATVARSRLAPAHEQNDSDEDDREDDPQAPIHEAPLDKGGSLRSCDAHEVLMQPPGALNKRSLALVTSDNETTSRGQYAPELDANSGRRRGSLCSLPHSESRVAVTRSGERAGHDVLRGAAWPQVQRPVISRWRLRPSPVLPAIETRARRCLIDVDGWLEPNRVLVVRGDGPRELVDRVALHERHGASAKPRSRHARAKALRTFRGETHHHIQLASRDLEVRTETVVAFVHQLPEAADITFGERIGTGQRRRVLEDDVARAPAGGFVELCGSRRERAWIHITKHATQCVRGNEDMVHLEAEQAGGAW